MTVVQTGSALDPLACRASRLAPQPIDYALSAAAALLLTIVLAALIRGASHWKAIPTSVWLHLATVGGALALSPVMLLRHRGDRWHRALGWTWIALVMMTAIVSFDIRTLMHGRLSPIHAISAFVLFDAPMIVWFARRHNVRGHSIAVRSTIGGALLIAGFFTLLPTRMLGGWLPGS